MGHLAPHEDIFLSCFSFVLANIYENFWAFAHVQGVELRIKFSELSKERKSTIILFDKIYSISISFVLNSSVRPLWACKNKTLFSLFWDSETKIAFASTKS